MRNKALNSRFKNFDFTLVILTTILSVIGIIMIASAVKSYDNSFKYVLVQTIALIAGLGCMYIITLIDFETLTRFSKYIYILGVILLIVVLTPLGTGREETGGQSWFRFGFIGLQPAELVKIFFIITFSTHLSKVKDHINEIKTFALLCLHFLVLAGLIMMQPDLGTVLVFAFIFLVMLFVAGLSYKYYLCGLGIAAVASPLLWFFFLNDYQKSRILAVFNPEQFIATYGYQAVQSKIAIGAGNFWGKGYMNGTQTQLEILPEKQTDFIFAVIGEEFGMIGCILVTALLVAIIVRIIKIGRHATTPTGTYICIGIATMFTFQAFENIGMCLGLTPVIGITLPFLSYGGSSLLTNLAALGLVLSVRQKSRSF